MTQDSVTVESSGRLFVVEATFTNRGDTAIRDPFFEVAELSGGNVVQNADGGPAGAGGTSPPTSAMVSWLRASQ